MCQNGRFWVSEFADFDFIYNLNGRKIQQFSHCVIWLPKTSLYYELLIGHKSNILFSRCFSSSLCCYRRRFKLSERFLISQVRDKSIGSRAYVTWTEPWLWSSWPKYIIYLLPATTTRSKSCCKTLALICYALTELQCTQNSRMEIKTDKWFIVLAQALLWFCWANQRLVLKGCFGLELGL